MNLNPMWPRNEFASSRYCLANPGEEYLVSIPDDDQVDVYLGIEQRTFSVEWFNTLTGETVVGEPIKGGGTPFYVALWSGVGVVFAASG